MNLFRRLLAVLGFVGLSQTAFAGPCDFFENGVMATGTSRPISDYEVRLQTCTFNDKSWISLRRFRSEGRNYHFMIEPTGLSTRIVDAACVRCDPDGDFHPAASAYGEALRAQATVPELSNKGGVAHAAANQGYFLSVDLCPSKKPLETAIFDNDQVRSRAGFPVAIAISGGWMHHHAEELDGLKARALNGSLNVVWVNHSYTHPYRPGVPNNVNFMHLEGVNFHDEVLNQEQYMISNGLTPSIFFRYPGLVSDAQMMAELSSYGLVALSADAWLALGQKPKPGSIVLIHGNGNEPYGVRLFLHWIDTLADFGVFQSLQRVL
jgi:hypothetical protein